MGRPVRVCTAKTVPLPPAGKHSRVHVPRAAAVDQRKRRITGQLSGTGIDQHRVHRHAREVISYSSPEIPVSLGVRHHSYFPVAASHFSADFKFLLGFERPP